MTVSSVFEFGLNSPVNRVVKAACLRFSRIVPSLAAWQEERLLLQLALETLHRVEKHDPISLNLDLEQSVSLRIRHHYAGMLRVYHLLLTGGGIAFNLEPRGMELPSFLFSLEQIFERFVRQTFVQALREIGITVLDGDKHQGRLFEDSDVYRTKSDLIFRRSKKEVTALGEVKYKPGLRVSDRYQIISHVTAARAPIGILFTPANEGESQHLERIGRLSTGAHFYHYRVNIGGDIGEAQTRMVQDIQEALALT